MCRTAKATWVTRRIPHDYPFEWRPVVQPTVGDVLLCEVLDPSLHRRVETKHGGRAKLYAGDHIICSLGNRYATSLLEASGTLAGRHLDLPHAYADLVSASGLCGHVLQRSERTARPTRLQVLRQAFVGAEPLNLRSFALPAPPAAPRTPVWVLVIGSAMDSGKTTACAALINGLAGAGLAVGAAKLTGTASARDVGSYRDAGAHTVLDFLDCGWPSTAGCQLSELTQIVDTLTGHVAAAGVDVAVLEIADGLLQSETAQLMIAIGRYLPGVRVVLTTCESMAAAAGAQLLRCWGHEVAAISGVVSSSPLARREVEQTTNLPCLPEIELSRQALQLAGMVGQPADHAHVKAVA